MRLGIDGIKIVESKDEYIPDLGKDGGGYSTLVFLDENGKYWVDFTNFYGKVCLTTDSIFDTHEEARIFIDGYYS